MSIKYIKNKEEGEYLLKYENFTTKSPFSCENGLFVVIGNGRYIK